MPTQWEINAAKRRANYVAPVEAAPPPPANTMVASQTFDSYQVTPEDKAAGPDALSAKLGISLNDLLSANGVSSISTGQMLDIPTPSPTEPVFPQPPQFAGVTGNAYRISRGSRQPTAPVAGPDGYVPQDTGMYESMTPGFNVAKVTGMVEGINKMLPGYEKRQKEYEAAKSLESAARDRDWMARAKQAEEMAKAQAIVDEKMFTRNPELKGLQPIRKPTGLIPVTLRNPDGTIGRRLVDKERWQEYSTAADRVVENGVFNTRNAKLAQAMDMASITAATPPPPPATKAPKGWFQVKNANGKMIWRRWGFKDNAAPVEIPPPPANYDAASTVLHIMMRSG